MNYKESLKILVRIIENKNLTSEEKEALGVCLGLLSWATLADSRIKNLRNKKERNIHSSIKNANFKRTHKIKKP